MNTQSLYDNNIDTIVTFQTFEHKQKYVRKNAKQKQHMNVGERKQCKQGYKQARSMKRSRSED